MSNQEPQAQQSKSAESLPANPILDTVSWNMLLKLWVLKFVCNHTWDVHFNMRVYDHTGKSLIRVEQTLVCQNCGKFKKLEL